MRSALRRHQAKSKSDFTEWKTNDDFDDRLSGREGHPISSLANSRSSVLQPEVSEIDDDLLDAITCQVMAIPLLLPSGEYFLISEYSALFLIL